MFAVIADRARVEFPDVTLEYTVCDEENPLLVTPLMHRVHQQIVDSGELVHVDSSSNMEEHNLRVFFMMTQHY